MQGNQRVAIILAAGRGSRLKELSLEQPKPLITVNNVTIIANLIRQLIDARIQHVVVVVGYLAEKIKTHLAPFEKQVSITYVENEIYDKTNNIYSLWLAKEYMKHGFFLFEADVFTEQHLVKKFLDVSESDVMLVDKFSPDMNGTVIKFNGQQQVTAMYLKSDQVPGFSFENTYKTVNFYKISAQLARSFFIQQLDYHIAQNDTSYYYELIIKEAVERGLNFYAFETAGLKWYEIDTRQDLDQAEKIFGQ